MTTKFVDCHLFHSTVPIRAALLSLASQENHDGPEYNLMIIAADYIKELEAKIESLETPEYKILSVNKYYFKP